jgi:hypothetical protein
MVKNRIKPCIGILTAGLILAAGCAEPPVGHAGGGSERPNPPAFTGTVKYEEPKAQPTDQAVVVSMYAMMEADTSGYEWYPTQVVYADSAGNFQIDSAGVGLFVIIAADEDGSNVAFTGYTNRLTATVSVSFDTITLAPAVNVQGTMQDSTGGPAQDIILCLIGTPYCDTIALGDTGYFGFNGLPAGSYIMAITAFSLTDSIIQLADSTTQFSALDSLLVNPGMVVATRSYISLPVNSWIGDSTQTLDTSYTAGYQDLPGLPQGQVDSVIIRNGWAEVITDKYSIRYTVD